MREAQSFDAAYYDRAYFTAGHDKGYAAEYTPQSAPWRALAAWVALRLQPRIVTDLASAHGFLVREFQKRGVLALGYDFSPYAVENAVAPVTEHDIRQPIEWELRNPPDVAFLLDVLEHQSLFDLDQVMVTLTVLNPRYAIIHAGLAGTEDEAEPSHVTLMTRDGWLAYFAENNFQPAAWQEEYRDWLQGLGMVGRFWAERAFAVEKPAKQWRETRDVEDWLKDEHLRKGIVVGERGHGAW